MLIRIVDFLHQHNLLLVLVAASILACSEEPPVAQSAFDAEAGPWQTVSINGAIYYRAAAKANATAQQGGLRISIPYTISEGSIRFSDTAEIAGRTYTTDCSATGGGTNDELPVEEPSPVDIRLPDNPNLTDREVMMTLYEATGGGVAWDNFGWGTDSMREWVGVMLDGDYVATIELAGYLLTFGQLENSIPPELGQLTQLRSLNLSGNQLSGSIPPELGQLTSLQDLKLYSNDLSGPIPPEFGQLTQLRSLILSQNQLSGSIPPELGQLTQLTELRLAGNQFSGCIPATLRGIPRHDLEQVGLLFCDE